MNDDDRRRQLDEQERYFASTRGGAPAAPRLVEQRSRPPWAAGLAVGALLIVAALLTRYTTLIIAYKGGDLSYVRGVCDSAIGSIGRAMSTTADHRCGQADEYYGFTTLALWGGALIAAVSAVCLIVSSNMGRPASGQQGRPE